MINKDIFELAQAQGVSEKNVKLLLLCVILLIVKFAIVPIVEWQSEIKEEIEFFQLQLRDEESVNSTSQNIKDKLEYTNAELEKVKQLYYTGSATSNQIKIGELVSKKAAELELVVSSQNVRILHTRQWYSNSRVYLYHSRLI